MMLNKRKEKFQVNCGATFNVISWKYVHDIYCQLSSMKLKIWNGTELASIGKHQIMLKPPKYEEILNSL